MRLSGNASWNLVTYHQSHTVLKLSVACSTGLYYYQMCVSPVDVFFAW